MKNKKCLLAKIKIFSLLVLIISLAAACSSGTETGSTAENQDAVGQDSINLRVTHILAEDHASHLVLVDFKEKVEERTNGRIQIDIFPNGQLYGSERESVEAVQLNNIDMTMVGTPTLASFENKFMVFDLPFLFGSREAAHAAMDGELGAKLNDLLPAINLVGLGYGENGFRHFLNNSHPIEKPEDLQGLKIRVMENKLYQDTFNLLGANASPLAFGELYSALQQKTFDGMDSPVSIISSSRFYEVQEYLTLSGHVYAPVITIINKDVFERIPADLVDIFTEEAANMHQLHREMAFEQDESLLEEIIAHGMKVNELTAEQKAVFTEKLQPIYDQYTEILSEELMELATSYN